MPSPRPDGASGADAYLMGSVRVAASSLIDVWTLGGREDDARECAALAVQQGVWNHPQQRPREHVSGLRTQPVHDPAQFWFVSFLEEQYPQIRAEIEQVLDRPLDPVRPTLEDGWLARSGSWRQAYLFRDGRWQDQVCARFPVTTAILAEIPEVTALSPGVVLISRLSPGTHIMPHCGATNAVLRLHLGVRVPGGATLRVADETLSWEEGRCLVFDDSFEHEVRHEGTEDRVVLIVDIAHPDLDSELRAGLLERRPGPEEHIVGFMREHGLERIDVRDGDLELYPDRSTRELLTTYLHGAGVATAELRGDKVVWHREPGEG